MAWSSKNYLVHHGILGMRWGHQNGPPYPLKLGAHSASEKAAGWEKSLRSSKGSAAAGTYFKDKNAFGDSRDALLIETDKRIMGDGTVIYPPVAKVIKDFENDTGTNPYQTKPGFEGKVSKVNPGYGEPGTTNNCCFCEVAMELQGRGYDVTARKSFNGASVGKVASYFDGAEPELCQSFDELKNDIIESGDGSSGTMHGYYGAGLGSGQGGHCLHWRNEKGNIIVADGQCGKELPFDSVVDEYGFNPGKCFKVRLDNATPNWDNLAKDGAIGLPNERVGGDEYIHSLGSPDNISSVWNYTDYDHVYKNAKYV